MTDRSDLIAASDDSAQESIPRGLPPGATLRRVPLPMGDAIELLIVPVGVSVQDEGSSIADVLASVTTTLRDWAAASAASPVVVPLYGCLVVQASHRAAVVGPPDRLDQLEQGVVDFAILEAELRHEERRGSVLLEAVESDAAAAAATESHSADHRAALAARYLEAVTVSRRLAMMAPAVHAQPVHPPTLASQLGERLRDRTRLIERHGVATDRAELAERVSDACSHRALEIAIARKQTGLEWAIVVLLVVQTAMLLVDLLARRGTS